MENLHDLMASLPPTSAADASERFDKLQAQRETQAEGRLENLDVDVDAEELRKKGNICFKEKRWDAAAEHYTKCIDAALLHLKKGSSNDISTCLLHAYTNRAETRLQLNEFQLALEDSNEALQIDSGNVKALYRKGRALVGLRDYKAACEYLEKAEKGSPGQKEIQDALREATALYISNSLLGFGPPLEGPDFVGRLEIKMTKDGRGRGLYATRNIGKGLIFLVSNAVAVTYDDNEWSARSSEHHSGNIYQPSKQDLMIAVVSAARKSQRLLQQLYSLDDNSLTVNLSVPSIVLFMTEEQMSLGPAAGKEKLQVNVNRVRNIVSCNSYEGADQTFASKLKLYEAKLVQRNQNFSGLWLLPSFINHSCQPNSTRVPMGSCMFIHASKPIKRGEEITVSYFDTLVPLLQRQAMCKKWGFQCSCRRCILEFSLMDALELIAARFEELHDKAVKEINAARSQEHFDGNLPACAEFAKIFVEVEEIIKNSALLKTEEEKNWIRASFVSAYLAGTQSNYFYPTTLTDYVPSREKVMKAIQNTVPGDIRTLIMGARHLKEADRITGHETESYNRQYASEQAREACIRVFAKHTEDVLKELVLQLSNCYLF